MAVDSTEVRPLGAYNHIDEKSGATYVKTTKVSYTWTIHNFAGLQKKTGESVRSPTFLAGANDEYKWQLGAYPNGDKADSSEHLSLFLFFIPSVKSEAEATFRACLLNKEKKEMNVKREPNLHKFDKTMNSLGWTRFVEKSFMQNPGNSLLPDDSLTIFFAIFISEGTVEISDSEELKTSESRLIDDLKSLFESPKFFDVTLVTPSREFKAHKSILATRSPVFSAMFHHDMLEKNANRVNITDVDDEVMLELLRFIYTGKIMNLDKMADGLLAAADKYQLQGLKILCTKSLFKNVTIANASSLLVFGDLYGCAQLKARALNFICAYTKEIFETESYKTMCATHPYLINEVFQAFAAAKALSGSTDGKTA